MARHLVSMATTLKTLSTKALGDGQALRSPQRSDGEYPYARS
jgi:hypothetical protein